MGWSGYGRKRRNGLRRTAGILFQRLFDMLDVFERIVEEKLDFGDVLQLVADALAKARRMNQFCCSRVFIIPALRSKGKTLT